MTPTDERAFLIGAVRDLAWGGFTIEEARRYAASVLKLLGIPEEPSK